MTARSALTSFGLSTGAALVSVIVFGWLVLLTAAFRRLRGMGPNRPAPVGRALALAILTISYAGLGIVLVLADAST